MPDSHSSPTAWDQAWSEAQPTIDAIRSSIQTWPIPAARIIRVGQLDAELLDQELVTVLKEPLNRALGQMGSVYETRYDSEITLLIRLVLYKFSMWNIGATYGAKLQDLKYTVTRVTKSSNLAPSGIPRDVLLVHGALTVLLPYIHSRLRSHALSHAWPDAPSADRKRRAWELLVRFETLKSTMGLLGFVVFLYDGKYRTIADRILGLKLGPSRSIVRRNVSYEFMNRQMVWHSFTEFLVFLLPLIDTWTVRRRLYKLYTKTQPSSLVPTSVRSYLGLSSSDAPTPEKSSVLVRRGKYWSLLKDQCAICAEDAAYSITNIVADSTLVTSSTPALRDTISVSSGETEPIFPITAPYRTSCGHEYCYFCLSERMIRASRGDDGNGEGWECLRCESTVTRCDRVVGIDEDIADIGSQDGFSDAGDLDHQHRDTSP